MLNTGGRVRETEERGSVKPGPAAIFSSGGECPAHLPSLKGTLLTLALLLSICLVPVLSSFPPCTSPLQKKKKKKENSNVSDSRLLAEDRSPHGTEATWWVAADTAACWKVSGQRFRLALL